MECIFCHAIKEEQILMETENYKVVLDIDPIQMGHLLIISKNHLMDIREIATPQLIELIELEKSIISILENDFSVTGASVIQNNGRIMDEGTHFHVHVVPRYDDDQFWGNQVVEEHPLALQELKDKLRLVKI